MWDTPLSVNLGIRHGQGVRYHDSEMAETEGGDPVRNGMAKRRVGASVRRSFAVLLSFLLGTALAQLPRETYPDPAKFAFWTPQQKPFGFRNTEKIFPVHHVKRGAKVFPLPRSARELEVPEIAKFMEENSVAGLLVIVDGRIQLERYSLGFDERSKWTSFSVAKSITSTLLGASIRDGFVRDVDDPVTTYLPGLKGSAYDGVTIRHILNMTSGVKWNEDYTDPNADVFKSVSATDHSRGSALVTYMSQLPREAEPGVKWAYKTGETNLLGAVVMAATNRSLADYLSEKIWSRFGMESDADWMLSEGKEEGGCCLAISLRDYGRFALFFMTGAKPVVPSTWTTDALKPSAASVAEFAHQGRTGGYGYQWWVGVDGPGTYTAIGIFGQRMYFHPEAKLIMVTLSAWTNATDPQRTAAVRAFEAAVVKAARSPER